MMVNKMRGAIGDELKNKFAAKLGGLLAAKKKEEENKSEKSAESKSEAGSDDSSGKVANQKADRGQEEKYRETSLCGRFKRLKDEIYREGEPCYLQVFEGYDCEQVKFITWSKLQIEKLDKLSRTRIQDALDRLKSPEKYSAPESICGYINVFESDDQYELNIISSTITVRSLKFEIQSQA